MRCQVHSQKGSFLVLNSSSRATCFFIPFEEWKISSGSYFETRREIVWLVSQKDLGKCTELLLDHIGSLTAMENITLVEITGFSHFPGFTKKIKSPLAKLC